MVRRVNVQQPVAWTAVLAIGVAGAGLVWHLLACVESPMAYSPSGDSLAFVTVEPWHLEKTQLAGEYAYRLMVLTGDRIRVVEQTTDAMLSGPAYSPNGRRLCYLRIPLFTKAAADHAKEETNRLRSQVEAENTFTWPAETRENSAAPEEDIDNQTLPRADAFREFLDRQRMAPRVCAQLVVRDVESDDVLSTTVVDLRLYMDDEDWALHYGSLRPQYSPDGRWVYLRAADMVVAVDPASGATRIVAAPAVAAALSPDGTLLAVLSGYSLGLVRTDGQRATYLHWNKTSSYCGLVWRDKNTLAVLEPKGEDETAWLHLVKRDATIQKSFKLAGPTGGARDIDAVAQLAMAPNGTHLVAAFGEEVLFLNSKGKVLQRIPNTEFRLVHPTFSPDSKRVAFKRIEEKSEAAPDYPRTTAIVVFTPDGRELTSIPVPPVSTGTTRPAPEADE